MNNIFEVKYFCILCGCHFKYSKISIKQHINTSKHKKAELYYQPKCKDNNFDDIYKTNH